MNQKNIDAYAEIPQVIPALNNIIDDLKSERKVTFLPHECCSLKINPGKVMPEVVTAFDSLMNVLNSKGVKTSDDGIPLKFTLTEDFAFEEYEVICTVNGAEVRAGDSEGMRRGIYFLEDRICEAPGILWTNGSWRRKPHVKVRISRCFFGPTYRPPFFIDELSNDIDYYPDNYLDKLAHEGINGLWLTMYFRDLPSDVLPHQGENTEKRLQKLQWTVNRCVRYGIKLYLFFSEPKGFGAHAHCIPESDASVYPEIKTAQNTFCTSTEAGKRYLSQSLEQIFSAVNGLGGIINIMFGEDNSCCANRLVYLENLNEQNCCPVCRKIGAPAVYADIARTMSQAIKKYTPDAVFIGWFYAPGCREDSHVVEMLAQVEEQWPEDCYFMLNFESGGTPEQLDKKRVVFDYSLAYVGPSKHFDSMTAICHRSGAKLQVGCSHEDASVPFIPVPGNLYRKYKYLYEHNVEVVMQCWYFGNYPGLMNKAAGELSFEPFPESEEKFLTALTAPEWRENAEIIGKAWADFSAAYRCFPANICFEWYGPLHNSIAWVWHLFPADAPIAPTWLVKQFPAVSGDRIGECLGYNHTFEEAIELVSEMDRKWDSGLKQIQTVCGNRPFSQLKDMIIPFAVSLQIKSTLNTLKFYHLREEMFYHHRDNLAEMAELVKSEIKITEEMRKLCEADPRLGYHSEAEAHLFHKEQLIARKKLLEELLNDDFAAFDIKAPFIQQWTGENPTGYVAVAGERCNIGNAGCWHAQLVDDKLQITLERKREYDYVVYLEPRRLWTPFRVQIMNDNSCDVLDFICREAVDIQIEFSNDTAVFNIPMNLFDGFRQSGFPVRFNIQAEQNGAVVESWGGKNSWQERLVHGHYNPADSGWLIL